MKATSNVRRLLAGLACAVSLASTGCIRGYTAPDLTAGLYDRAYIEYELLAGEYSVACKGDTPVAGEAQLVSYQPPLPVPPADAHGTLTIQYPGASDPSRALVRLEMVQNDPNSPQSLWRGPREIKTDWTVEVPKTELDKTIAALREQGYFRQPGKMIWSARLTTRLDNAENSKRWSQVPELNQLVRLARQHGRIVQTGGSELTQLAAVAARAGTITQPGVTQPGVAQPGVAQPGVAQPAVAAIPAAAPQAPAAQPPSVAAPFAQVPANQVPLAQASPSQPPVAVGPYAPPANQTPMQSPSAQPPAIQPGTVAAGQPAVPPSVSAYRQWQADRAAGYPAPADGDPRVTRLPAVAETTVR